MQNLYQSQKPEVRPFPLSGYQVKQQRHSGKVHYTEGFITPGLRCEDHREHAKVRSFRHLIGHIDLTVAV